MKYQTKQRDLLIKLLSSHHDEIMTAESIMELFKDHPISRSAIYRNLSSLESEGSIKRVTVSGSPKVYYQFVGSEDCRHHLHMQCSKCNKTFHMGLSTTSVLIENVLKDSNFIVDSRNTTLYGICENCQRRKSDERTVDS